MLRNVEKAFYAFVVVAYVIGYASLAFGGDQNQIKFSKEIFAQVTQQAYVIAKKTDTVKTATAVVKTETAIAKETATTTPTPAPAKPTASPSPTASK